MTTGTRSFDQFVNHPNGYGFIGTKGFESWTGVDTPKSARSRTKRIIIKTTRLVKKRDGTMKIVPYVFKVRDPSDTSPSKVNVPKPENPYSKTYRFLSSVYTQVGSKNGDYFAYSTWCGSNFLWPPSTQPANVLTANDQNKLINKLWSQVKGSDFDAGVFLGEAHQSLSMIADTAIRIAKSVWHIRRGDISGSLRSLVEGTSRAPLMARRRDSRLNPALYPNLRSDAKSQANLFLELQFGWLPLLSDTVAASEMLANHLELPARKVYRVMVEARRSTVVMTGAFTGVLFDVKQVHTRHLKAIISEKSPPSMMEKLGLTDPASVAWELAPFSFVVDWFLPIGQSLEARAASQALRGTFVTSDKQMCMVEPGNGQYYKFPRKVGGRERNINFTRTVSDQLKPVLPSFKPLNKVFSVVHVLDSIALMTQILTKPSGRDGSSLQGASARNRALQLSL